MTKISMDRYQNSKIINYPGVFIYDTKTYWHVQTFFKVSLKYILSLANNEDIIIRVLIEKSKRYNYVLYRKVFDFEVDMQNDLFPFNRYEYDVFNKNGIKIEHIIEKNKKVKPYIRQWLCV